MGASLIEFWKSLELVEKIRASDAIADIHSRSLLEQAGIRSSRSSSGGWLYVSVGRADLGRAHEILSEDLRKRQAYWAELYDASGSPVVTHPKSNSPLAERLPEGEFRTFLESNGLAVFREDRHIRDELGRYLKKAGGVGDDSPPHPARITLWGRKRSYLHGSIEKTGWDLDLVIMWDGIDRNQGVSFRIQVWDNGAAYSLRSGPPPE